MACLDFQKNIIGDCEKIKQFINENLILLKSTNQELYQQANILFDTKLVFELDFNIDWNNIATFKMEMRKFMKKLLDFSYCINLSTNQNMFSKNRDVLIVEYEELLSDLLLNMDAAIVTVTNLWQQYDDLQSTLHKDYITSFVLYNEKPTKYPIDTISELNRSTFILKSNLYYKYLASFVHTCHAHFLFLTRLENYLENHIDILCICFNSKKSTQYS